MLRMLDLLLRCLRRRWLVEGVAAVSSNTSSIYSTDIIVASASALSDPSSKDAWTYDKYLLNHANPWLVASSMAFLSFSWLQSLRRANPCT